MYPLPCELNWIIQQANVQIKKIKIILTCLLNTDWDQIVFELDDDNEDENDDNDDDSDD